MATQRIQLAVQEPLGVDRPDYPVTLGVPFPRGALQDGDQVAVEVEGSPVPVQTRSLLNWTDDSVRWLLVDFQMDLASGAENLCDLVWGDAAIPVADAEPAIHIEESSEGIAVCTGPLTFTVAPEGPLPLATAAAHGTALLEVGDVSSTVRLDGVAYSVRAAGPATVEEAGPLRAVICAQGKATAAEGPDPHDSGPGFDVTVRLYAFAGRADLRMYFTIANRVPRELVRLEELTVSLAPQLGDRGGRRTDGFIVSSVDTGGHREAHVDCLVEGRRAVRVGLVDMPYPPWEPGARDAEGQTPEQPRVAAPHYSVIPGDEGAEETLRNGANWCNLMPMAATLGNGERSVTFMCRRPWHQAPKEMSVANGRVALSLYPAWAEPLELYRGVAKTHELIVDFGRGPVDTAERVAFACGVEKRPAPQVATRNWMVDSGAFGPLFRYQPYKYRWWEFILRAALQRETFNVESQPLMGFHFLNYGDYWRTGRGGQWYNNEMDRGYGLLLQMVRTGNPVVFEHLEPIIHHQIDVDTCHDASEDWWVGSQRYHFAKHGATCRPALCHQWIEGPLFYYFLTGYRRAEEVALARADHFCKAVDEGEHRGKTLTRVAGYPLMALSRMYDHYGEARYLATCDKIMDWLEEWWREDGGFFYVGYHPPGNAAVATALSDGILSCALMRHHLATGSERSFALLKAMVDQDLNENGLFLPEGFSLKSNSPWRNYHEPEPDFYFEPLVWLTEKTGNRQYAETGYADMQRIFVQRRMINADSEGLPPHFYRYWLPFLARADELGLLDDPKPF